MYRPRILGQWFDRIRFYAAASSPTVRIEKTSKGFQARYRGGTGYAPDEAMHQSGNKVFVAGVSDSPRDDVEQTLIWQFRHSEPYRDLRRLD